MKMIFPIGKDDVLRDKKSALEYISGLNRKNIQISPERLHVVNDGKVLYLEIFDDKIKQAQIRQSFLLKLLKWFSFPTNQLKILDIDTVTSLLNDYLLAIKRINVNVKLEYDEALTITSDKYCEIEDSEIIKRLDDDIIDMIYFTDLSTHFRTKTKFDIKPFPNDKFGVGMNIVNSETGFKAFQINNYLFRYICSNGSYVKDYVDDIKYYHYNLFAPDVYDIINSKVKSLKDRASELELQIKNLDETISRNAVQKVNQNIYHQVGVRLLSDILEDDRMPSKYELFNLITDRAKDYALSKRILLEEIAGKLLN